MARSAAGWRDAPEGALYTRILGTAFATLPEALKALPLPGPVVTYDGWLEPTRI